MKQFFTLRNAIAALMLSMLFTSCSSKDVTAPLSNNVSAPVSYSDANIGINNFQASEVSNQELQVSFSLLYANNVTSIQVLSGSSPNQLCSFYQVNVPGNLTSATSYSVNDTNIKGSTMYFMIKFTLSDGNWGYTPVYSLQVKQ